MATKAKKTTKTVSAKKSATKKRVKKPEYWFAAKRYGYGWGRALTWQGWVVYLAFVASVAWYLAWAANRVASEQTLGLSEQSFVVGGLFILLAIAVPVLVVICALKGEPAKWRWGNTKRK